MGTRDRVDALREIGIKRIVQEGNNESDGFCFGAAQSTRHVIGGVIQLGNRPVNPARGGLGYVGMMVEHPGDSHGAYTGEASYIAYGRLRRRRAS